MKSFLTAIAIGLPLIVSLPVSAQQYASAGEYKTCSAAQTRLGMDAVRDRCGTLIKPSVSATLNSEAELNAALAGRDAFQASVDAYGGCVTEFINSFRRPGADANSTTPDEAACAHAWAEDAVTQTVLEVGRACVDYSNRSVLDPELVDFSGACYPDFGSDRG